MSVFIRCIIAQLKAEWEKQSYPLSVCMHSLCPKTHEEREETDQKLFLIAYGELNIEKNNSGANWYHIGHMYMGVELQIIVKMDN